MQRQKKFFEHTLYVVLYKTSLRTFNFIFSEAFIQYRLIQGTRAHNDLNWYGRGFLQCNLW